jgi:hypothetical protein
MVDLETYALGVEIIYAFYHIVMPQYHRIYEQYNRDILNMKYSEYEKKYKSRFVYPTPWGARKDPFNTSTRRRNIEQGLKNYAKNFTTKF